MFHIWTSGQRLKRLRLNDLVGLVLLKSVIASLASTVGSSQRYSHKYQDGFEKVLSYSTKLEIGITALIYEHDLLVYCAYALNK